MRTDSHLSRRGARDLLWRALLAALALLTLLLLLLLAPRSASAQCFPNPTGETAVGLRNATSHYLLFFIDDMRMDGVPTGDLSTYFIVAPGEHHLRAEAVIVGEIVSASRTAFVLAGQVCMWTVTDPQDKPVEPRRELRDSLRREPPRDFAGWRVRRL